VGEISPNQSSRFEPLNRKWRSAKGRFSVRERSSGFRTATELLELLYPSSLQGVGWRQGAHGASRGFASLADVVNTAGWTRWNAPRTVQFDVRREVVWKIDWLAVGQTVLQGELTRGGIYLAEAVDAGVRAWGCAGFDEIGNGNRQDQTAAQDANDAPNNDVRGGYFFLRGFAHTSIETPPAKFRCAEFVSLEFTL
jgi:hypothetical protein